MKHPEIVLLPILMFSDYFLTVLGAVQKRKKYDEHFQSEHYELNPRWQKQIAQRKWFNPRHIFCTVLISGLLAYLLETDRMPESFAEGALGCLFIAFGMIVGRHLSNILTFRRVFRRHDEISGQVTMTHSLLLSISTYQYLAVAVPMILLAVFSPTPFVLGGLVGVGLIFVAHGRWILQNRKRGKTVGKTSAPVEQLGEEPDR